MVLHENRLPDSILESRAVLAKAHRGRRQQVCQVDSVSLEDFGQIL